jgi:hypothetical protein
LKVIKEEGIYQAMTMWTMSEKSKMILLQHDIHISLGIWFPYEVRDF